MLEFTPTVVVAKVTLVWPEGTVTVDGTEADGDPDIKLINAPLGPVAPLNITVPVELLPPITVDGLKVTDTIVNRLMVNVADCVEPLKDPEIVEVNVLLTVVVVIVKVAVV